MSEPAVLADLVSAAARIGSVGVPLLFAGLAFQGLGLLLRGVAWRNLLAHAHPGRSVGIGTITAGYVAGAAANGMLPAKAGELIKVGVARRSIQDSATPAIVGSLGLLSAFDAVVGVVITMVLIATGTVPAVHVSQLIPAIDPRIAVVAAVALVVGTVLVGRFAGMHSRLVAGASAAKASARILRSPRRYLRTVVVFQLAAWGCRLMVAALLLEAFGLKPSPASAATVVVLGGLAGMVPGSPGGLGAQQVVLVYALGSTAAAANIIAFSVGMQLALMAFQALLGIVAVMLIVKVAHPLRAARALRASVLDAPG